MANITAQNRIRYEIDRLSLRTSGVISTKDSSPVSLSNVQAVTGITITGSQPAGTYRYFAFKISGAWGKLTSSGTFSAFAVNSCDIDNLEAYGNTSAELSALTNIPALAGKTFGIAIALIADDIDTASPECALAFKCRNDTQQKTTTLTSQVYQLGNNSRIISTGSQAGNSGGGNVAVSAQITKPDGTLSSWQGLHAFDGEKALTIQFKADYSVNAVGSDIARLEFANVIYSQTANAVSGAVSGEIITKSLDWYMPVKTCRLSVNHSPISLSTIKAYVTFREQPVNIRGETLGVGTGAVKTYQLQRTGGINPESIVLYSDGSRIFTDYQLNTSTGKLTCNIPSGSILACDYEYGWDFEEWKELTLSSRSYIGANQKSEYRITIPENTKSIAAVKLVMNYASGRITNETIGTGTGRAKTYKLSRRVKNGVISLTANSTALSAQNFTLQEDTQYVSAAAPSGQTLKASYDWLSEPVNIYQISAVFS